MKHNIELTEEQIQMLADGLCCMTWAIGPCAVYVNAEKKALHINRLKHAKALCESFESLLSKDVDRQVWPEYLS